MNGVLTQCIMLACHMLLQLLAMLVLPQLGTTG
jgi:hypothetical protein